MPNTFITLEVPTSANSTGAPVYVGNTGHPKTFVRTGPISGRYVVEGSNDGGSSWDILIDDNDGTQVLFASPNAGAKTVDCVVEQVRVRSLRNTTTGLAPSMTMGAPPSLGYNVFGKIEVPTDPGVGSVFDVGLGVGPLKTFILRGAVPERARFTILASMDGTRFDETLLFTADQQGARSARVMCRYLRVLRGGAAGPAPALSVGCEPVTEAGGVSFPPATGDPPAFTLALDPKRAVSGTGEEVLYEYPVPLRSLPGDQVVAELSAFVSGGDGSGPATFRVRIGGTPRVADGAQVATVGAAGSEAVQVARGPAFDKPGEPVTLVKITAERTGAAMAGFFLSFRGVQAV
jgi:hypothetical protein